MALSRSRDRAGAVRSEGWRWRAFAPCRRGCFLAIRRSVARRCRSAGADRAGALGAAFRTLRGTRSGARRARRTAAPAGRVCVADPARSGRRRGRGISSIIGARMADRSARPRSCAICSSHSGRSGPAGQTGRRAARRLRPPSGDAGDGLVPFHKLTQWLAYSLIEPLAAAGIQLTDIDGLTGLAEYRNGGLFGLRRNRRARPRAAACRSIRSASRSSNGGP